MAEDSGSQGVYLPRILRRSAALAAAGCAFVAGCGAAGGGETRYENSPQFREGLFRNMANPDELPSASAWRIWSRFIVGSKVDTVPVDAIPVHALDRAEARCARHQGQPRRAAGPFVAPAQAARQVLADRSGVQRPRLARAMGRPQALSQAADRAGTVAAHRGRDPLARPLRPPRRGHHRIPCARACSATSCRWACARGWSKWACPPSA
jgi:hypothetical protein